MAEPSSSETGRADTPPRATLIRLPRLQTAMADAAPRTTHKHSVSFLAALAFTAGFFGARLFHLVFPDTEVFIGPIHVHHFWYGLGLIVLSGWLGIAYNSERHNRTYAVLFGLGLGFIGDEVGLLLTFGNYFSPLTYDFFIAAVCFIVLLSLLARDWKEVESDVFRVSTRERLIHIGIFLAGFSTIFLAYDFPNLAYVGIPFAVVGALLLLVGLWHWDRTTMAADR